MSQRPRRSWGDVCPPTQYGVSGFYSILVKFQRCHTVHTFKTKVMRELGMPASCDLYLQGIGKLADGDKFQGWLRVVLVRKGGPMVCIRRDIDRAKSF
jgi:hypothetical protein